MTRAALKSHRLPFLDVGSGSDGDVGGQSGHFMFLNLMTVQQHAQNRFNANTKSSKQHRNAKFNYFYTIMTCLISIC